MQRKKSGYKRLYDRDEEEELQVTERSWRRLHQCNAKLASTSEMTSLMACFAVAAAVELKLVAGETSETLIIALAVTTSLLVAVMMLVKTVTVSLIPYLESVASVSETRDVTRSPHEVMINLINITWLVGTVFLPSLFVLDLVIMAWIKFSYFTIEAAYAATLILLPVLIIIMGFGIVFLRQTINPDQACIQLSKGNRNYNRRKYNSHQLDVIPQSQSSRRESSERDWPSDSSLPTNQSDEDLMLLSQQRFPTYTFYGSILPATPFYGIDLN